jgi:hypothetical protein
MAACTIGQKPFQTSSSTGDTPEQSCAAYAATQTGYELEYMGQSVCVLRSSTARLQQATTQVCDPATPHFSLQASTGLTQAKVTDYMALWAAFLTAAVVVLAAKALYNKFRIDTGNA